MPLIILLLIVVVFLAIGPLLLIWALNTLGFVVAYGFWQWLAALVVLFLIGRGR